MTTTIQVSKQLQESLTQRKIYERETYEEILWNLLEDTMELSEETKREIAEARAEIKAGKTSTLEEVKKHLGI